MGSYTHREYVELFHLLFLAQLGQKLEKKRYALKGGCNLRFYFKSIRYSEDIDLDVQTEPVDILRDKVNGILNSKPFREILQVREIEIEHVTESKQTETTQRWKLGLRTPAAEVPLPSKIEFSRRGMDENVRFEAIDPEIIRAYQLSPIIANHYPAEVAFRQKIESLVTRSATQARDIFDLHLLLTSKIGKETLSKDMKHSLEELQAKTMSVGFEVFKGQLLSYLPPGYQAQYDSASVWENIVLEVVEYLERSKS